MNVDLVPGLAQNLLWTFLIASGVQLTLWVICMITRDATPADWWWGAGFGVIALFTYFNTQGVGVQERRLLLTACTVVWGLRLSMHIFLRHKADNFRELDRYEKYRKDAKAEGISVNWYLYKRVFGIQGVMMWITSIPVQVGQFYLQPTELGWLAAVGFAVWAIGFLIESVCDWQLQRFKTNPANKGKVLNTGLWRYSRHPNYFGDALVWWGLFLMACENPIGWLLIFAPARMHYRLAYRQGIVWLENKMSNLRPEYADYIRRTNRFYPWFPKKG